MAAPRPRTFAGPAGRLDARLHGPADGAPVLLLHPHPQWGGTMGSRLVHDLAGAIAAAGHLAVRFDFRGVGRSQGMYGQGVGESADAAAVFDALQTETGEGAAVVGYSFGGAVACRLASERPVRRLVLVGTPLRLTESLLVPMEDAHRVRAPTHIVVGDRDGFVPVPDAEALAAAFSPPAEVTVLPGAGHFLEPSHNPRAVAAVLAALAA
ncbi:MAG: alpha/beta fold hydrolase [Halobacteriales archaeon]|nr:alpha/beta fold hydrolase [Halobacteriales archaeon]